MAKLVHRDLKPANVILSASGPRVIDFGIARALDSDAKHTQTGFIVGSPGWIPPEQVFENQVSTAGDVFTWGTLIAYAATGRHPYGSGTLMVLAVRAHQGEHDLTGIPDDLRPLVTAALGGGPGAAARHRAVARRPYRRDRPGDRGQPDGRCPVGVQAATADVRLPAATGHAAGR